MAKLGNRKKESIAVSAIDNETNRQGSYLVAEIPKGDKAPSFDGHITVYKDDSEKAESYINDVPTQVKGTGVKEFSKGNRNFRLDLVHYQNYYKRGGCLLLVVEILENTETKIFYKQLLPVELKEIIDNWGNQQTKSVELRPLDETSLYIVCRKFIDQMIKQPQILIEQNKYNDEDYEKLIFTSLTFDPQKSGFKDIFNHDFIQFGLKDNIEYPLRKMKLDTFGIGIIEEINVNGKIFNLEVKSLYTSSTITKIIEDCLEVTINEEKDKLRFNFRFTQIKSVATHLKVLTFLIEILNTGIVNISDFHGKIQINNCNQYIQELENIYGLFLDLSNLFKKLNINENIEFGNGDNILLEIEHLVKVLIYKDYSNLNIENPDEPSFTKFTIGNKVFIFLYDPFSKDKFIDAFSEEVMNMPVRAVVKDTGETIRLSPYLLLLSEKDTKNIVNINFEVIQKSFDYIEFDKTDLIFGEFNNFCLVCINAFDETGTISYLDLASNLLNKLQQYSEDKNNSNIILINLMQVKFRKNNGLEQEDYMQLLKLKNSLTENSELIFCISVLLKSKKEAELYFDQFEKERKDFYRTLPIYKLYQDIE